MKRPWQAVNSKPPLPSCRLSTEDADEEGGKPPEELLEAGQHLTGKIQSIHADSVFLDLGYRSPGVIPLRQFVSGKKPEVGQRIEVLVDRIAHEEGLIYLNLPKGVRRIAGNWESLAKGQIVDCLVNRTNKGGLEVTVSGLRAFLPSSQVELGFISDLTPYVGQKLRVEVMEVNARKRNLVVSRRAYLQIERKEPRRSSGKPWPSTRPTPDKVKTIKDYGAFVDLGGRWLPAHRRDELAPPQASVRSRQRGPDGRREGAVARSRKEKDRPRA